MGKTKNAKENLENLVGKLRERFDRWIFLFENGGSDPFWPDGVNLNLVRNHICCYKKQIEEICPDGQRPEIYYRDTPQKVDDSYMAKADKIRSDAKESLRVYKCDKNYRYLITHADALHPKDAEKISVRNVIGYISGLERAIAEDDLVFMRRHCQPDGYLESFARCADKVMAALENPYQGQMNFFSLLCEQEDSDVYDEEQEAAYNIQ